MAFYIELEKIAETDDDVTYRYYSGADFDNDFGEYVLDKKTNEITILRRISTDTKNNVLKRAVMCILKAYDQDGVWKDKAIWAS